jgi:hypothetical protein
MPRHLRCLLVFLLTVACALTAGLPATAQPGPTMNGHMTDANGVIHYWLTIGAFDIGDVSYTNVLDYDFLKTGAVPRPLPGDTVVRDGVTYTWQGMTSSIDGVSVFGDLYGEPDNAIAYLVSYVVADRDIPGAALYWASDDLCTVYVNGVEVGRNTGGHAVMPDSDISADFTLNKGVNVIMMKVVNYITAWGAFARLVGADGLPLAGLPIVAAPAEKVAPADFGWVLTSDSPLEVPAAHIPSKYSYLSTAVNFMAGDKKTATLYTNVSVRIHTIEVHDVKSGKTVYTIPGDGGAFSIPVNTGYSVTRTITFTAFATPGSYTLYSPECQLTSPTFVIR